MPSVECRYCAEIRYFIYTTITESSGVMENSVAAQIVMHCWPTDIHDIQNMFRIICKIYSTFLWFIVRIFPKFHENPAITVLKLSLKEMTNRQTNGGQNRNPAKSITLLECVSQTSRNFVSLEQTVRLMSRESWSGDNWVELGHVVISDVSPIHKRRLMLCF